MSGTVKRVYDGRVIKLGIESVTLPNGIALDLEIVRHPGGAAVVAVDEREQVCLLRQYRHASGGWLWELPAGKLEMHEPADATAKRELLEEAGLKAAIWKKLGEIILTPGFCDEVIHLYLARQLTARPAQPEAHELFEIHWVPFTTALEQIYDGTIVDAKTMLGLTLAARAAR
jgi:8-oxo-dGTP pyrophosphatase MutT (NUDIX family)